MGLFTIVLNMFANHFISVRGVLLWYYFLTIERYVLSIQNVFHYTHQKCITLIYIIVILSLLLILILPRENYDKTMQALSCYFY